jgi:hypothetical protein
MLAEIFFLRVEAMARFSKEAAPAQPSRFVALSPEAFNALRERRENARTLMAGDCRYWPASSTR